MSSRTADTGNTNRTDVNQTFLQILGSLMFVCPVRPGR